MIHRPDEPHQRRARDIDRAADRHSTGPRTVSPLRTTRASLTVAEASRPAEIKLMAVPGRVPARSARRSLPGQDGGSPPPRTAAAWPVAEARLRPGWPRRGRGQGGAVVVFGIKPSPPSAARVVASSVRSRSNASRSLVPLATWRAAAPWPRTERHSLLIDTGAPSRRRAVRATNESRRNQPSSDPARPIQKLLAGKGLPVRLSPTMTDSRNRPGFP